MKPKQVITGEEMDEVELRDKKRKRKHSLSASVEIGKSKKKQKVVFDLPGQKRPTPSERDPLRIFYETLYKQVPGCELAQIWMMESGLLSREEAKQIYEKQKSKALTSAAIADIDVGTSAKREQVSGKKKRTETKVMVKKSSKHKCED
ncbi:uncharacterized protein LOC116189376 isoform X2 [Punica granatum]|uniref:Uncharacterized protein LOC116189376 isoform X2 n=1 Tax=Punica granatum TaxID=22663 RepID=A0A6P8BZ66_PUNGR|nr:uncharacterized protein LOC116189376 isoform X2 [Punica granatum]